MTWDWTQTPSSPTCGHSWALASTYTARTTAVRNTSSAHLPSGHFWANSAWLVCATIAFNLTRAAGALASAFHAKATTGTIRAQLITVPGRLARSARRLTLHLPTAWPWQKAWEQLAAAANSPPLAA